MDDERRRYRNTGKKLDTGLHADINNQHEGKTRSQGAQSLTISPFHTVG